MLDPTDPPGLNELQDAGRVVGIVATEAAHTGGWGVGVAVDVARAWSNAGVRLILADGSLAEPRLHDAVGIENGEGVSDALAFGSSIRRVARRVEGEGYFAVAAGTAMADAEQAMSGGRWAHLCAGFRDAGVTLAVYLNAGDPATAIALQEASHALVVGAEGDEVPDVVSESGVTLLGTFTAEEIPPAPLAEAMEPAVDEAAEPTADTEDEVLLDEGFGDLVLEEGDAEAVDEPEAIEDVEDLPPDLVTDEPGAEALEPEPIEAGADAAGPDDVDFGARPEGDPEEALFQHAVEGAEAPEDDDVAQLEEILEESEGTVQKGGSRRNILFLVLLLVILGVLVAGWFGYVEIPGITPTAHLTSGKGSLA